MKKSTFYLLILLICPFFLACSDEDEPVTNLEEIYGTWYSQTSNGQVSENDSLVFVISPEKIVTRSYFRLSKSSEWRLITSPKSKQDFTSQIVFIDKHPGYVTSSILVGDFLLEDLKEQLDEGFISIEQYELFIRMFTVNLEIHYKLLNQNLLQITTITDKKNENGTLVPGKEETITEFTKISNDIL